MMIMIAAAARATHTHDISSPTTHEFRECSAGEAGRFRWLVGGTFFGEWSLVSRKSVRPVSDVLSVCEGILPKVKVREREGEREREKGKMVDSQHT